MRTVPTSLRAALLPLALLASAPAAADADAAPALAAPSTAADPVAAAPAAAVPAPAAPALAEPSSAASGTAAAAELAAPSSVAPATPALAAAAPSAPATVATRAAFSLPAPAGMPQVAWYVPRARDAEDAELPWNRSVFGAFDPWTNDKLTVLYEHQGISGRFLKGKSVDDGGSSGGGISDWPSGNVKATLDGVRLELGRLGLAYMQGRGDIRWDFSTGAQQLDVNVQGGEITWSFGAWAFADFAGPDIRLGLAWPELFLRGQFGQRRDAPVSGGQAKVTWAFATAGSSLIGLRATAGDTFFLELRTGDLYGLVTYAELVPSGGSKQSVVHPGYGFSFLPTIRAGFAF